MSRSLRIFPIAFFLLAFLPLSLHAQEDTTVTIKDTTGAILSREDMVAQAKRYIARAGEAKNFVDEKLNEVNNDTDPFITICLQNKQKEISMTIPMMQEDFDNFSRQNARGDNINMLHSYSTLDVLAQSIENSLEEATRCLDRKITQEEKARYQNMYLSEEEPIRRVTVPPAIRERLGEALSSTIESVFQQMVNGAHSLRATVRKTAIFRSFSDKFRNLFYSAEDRTVVITEDSAESTPDR